MTDPGSMYDACYASLVRCLTTVAEHCPEIPTQAPPLHRLRNLVQVLRATTPSQVNLSDSELSLSAALTVLSTSQELVATLAEAGAGGRISGEMQEALADTVPALAAQLGTALRQRKAIRVRGLYVIIDPQVTNGRDPMQIATAAVRGGARMLQLRDKMRDKGEVLPLAINLQIGCQA